MMPRGLRFNFAACGLLFSHKKLFTVTTDQNLQGKVVTRGQAVPTSAIKEIHQNMNRF
jgi:hypothetical protein